MIWGCMLYDGPGYMCKIDGGMDKHLYIEILEDHLQKSAEFYGRDLDDMVFPHDNHPKHKAKVVQAWLKGGISKN